MNREKLKEVLETYAEELKADFDWKAGGPYMPGCSMPGGYTFVKNGSGEVIATFHTKGTSPSFPISARDVQGSQILAEVLNAISGGMS